MTKDKKTKKLKNLFLHTFPIVFSQFIDLEKANPYQAQFLDWHSMTSHNAIHNAKCATMPIVHLMLTEYCEPCKNGIVCTFGIQICTIVIVCINGILIPHNWHCEAKIGIFLT